MSGRGWTDADVARVQDRLEELVRDLPGVVVEESFGHVGYLLGGRRFAWLFVDHHGDGRLALCVKAPPGEQETLIAADPDRYFRPAYVHTWVGILLHGVEPDWDQVAELLEQGCGCAPPSAPGELRAITCRADDTKSHEHSAHESTNRRSAWRGTVALSVRA